MRVTVDASQCDGHARCIVLAPEVFDFDDDEERSVVIQAHPADEAAARARRAAGQCPKQAITIEEGDE